MSIPFDRINAAALAKYPHLLERWLPGGLLIGREYTCGNLNGDHGESCKVNIDTGSWADFATDDKGGDPVSLYAAINDLNQGEAAKELARELGIEIEEGGNGRKIVATYDYQDAEGQLVFQTVRFHPKDFRQRRPDGTGGWEWNLKGVKPIPYRLPEVLTAKEVYVVEGEKDADALAKLGIVATCNAMGAEKWRKEHADYLRDKIVRIIPDNDDAGHRHALKVARSLDGVAASIKIVELSGLPHKGDVSDWLRTGGDTEKLQLFAEAAPEWKNKQNTAEAESQGEDGENVPGADSSGPEFLPSPKDPPLECLPRVLQLVIIAAATAFCVPLSVPFAALLMLIASCIGYTRRLKVSPTWFVPAILFMVLVGRSGIGKSPCIRQILKPYYDEDLRKAQKYKMDLKKYEEEIEEWMNLKSQDKRHVPKPKEPIWMHHIVDDATIEAIAEALYVGGNENVLHRGVLWCTDEFAGLLASMDKYTPNAKGSTKARLMSAYDALEWKVNRVLKGRTLYIRHAVVNVFGTIQPAVLSRSFDKIDALSGLLSRISFIRVEPAEPPKWKKGILSREHEQILEDIAQRLLHFDYENREPKDIKLSPEADMVYGHWFERLAAESWIDPSASDYESLNAKLRGICLRLALILHCLHAVCAKRSEMEPISVQTMRDAIAVTDWLKDQQQQVWRLMGHGKAAKEALPLEKRVAEAIVALEVEIVDGLLPTSRIAEKLNEGCHGPLHVNPGSVGRTYKKLGLAPHRDNKIRGVRIMPRELEQLKAFVRPQGGPSVPSTPENDPPAPAATEQAPGDGDGYEKASPCVTAVRGCNRLDSDASDGSDGFFDEDPWNDYSGLVLESLGQAGNDEKCIQPVDGENEGGEA